MKKSIIFGLLLFIFYSAGAYEIETSSHIYFVITPEGQYVMLGIVPSTVSSLNEKEYINYSGTILGDEEWSKVGSLLQLRKDGTQYFCYDSKTGSEHVLFDYGLKKGSVFADDFEDTIYEVTDVRDTLINDENLRLIELLSHNGKHDVWIEGIGSLYTGILRANKYYRDACLLLSCHYEGEDWESEIEEHPKYFFPNNQNIKTANMNVTMLQWDKPIETEADMETYLEWVHALTDLNAEFVSDTLHIWGRYRTSCGLHSYAACEVRDTQIFFKQYPYDFIHEADCANNYEIETRIPGFEKGKYEVKLSWNKTLELECLGNNPTSVNIIASPSKKNGTYDLSGRKLPDKPARGIYIENGKKKVK